MLLNPNHIDELCKLMDKNELRNLQRKEEILGDMTVVPPPDYNSEEDKEKALYICSKSKTLVDEAQTSIVTSRICSKIK